MNVRTTKLPPYSLLFFTNVRLCEFEVKNTVLCMCASYERVLVYFKQPNFLSLKLVGAVRCALEMQRRVANELVVFAENLLARSYKSSYLKNSGCQCLNYCVMYSYSTPLERTSSNERRLSPLASTWLIRCAAAAAASRTCVGSACESCSQISDSA